MRLKVNFLTLNFSYSNELQPMQYLRISIPEVVGTKWRLQVGEEWEERKERIKKEKVGGTNREQSAEQQRKKKRKEKKRKKKK